MPSRPLNVHHPRYGATPVTSDTHLTAKERAELDKQHTRFLKADGHQIFPQSALRADPFKQCVMSHFAEGLTFYVDRLGPCARCSRPFIFYALEQQYWYETLGFPVDIAQCVACVECRKSNQALRRALRTYETHSSATALSAEQARLLVKATIALIDESLLKNRSKAHTVRKLCSKALEKNELTALESAISNMKDQ